MPEVNLEDVKKALAKKEKENPSIKVINIGGKNYFTGVHLPGKTFDDYGECVSRNEEASRQKMYKELGLNELGQSPEQVKRAKKFQELVEDKNKLLEEVRKIDIKIALVNSGRDYSDGVVEKTEKKRKTRKK